MEEIDISTIDTQLGKIPVVLQKETLNNNTTYIATVVLDNTKLQAKTPTKKSSIIGIKNSIDIQFENWLVDQLKEI